MALNVSLSHANLCVIKSLRNGINNAFLEFDSETGCEIQKGRNYRGFEPGWKCLINGGY